MGNHTKYAALAEKISGEIRIGKYAVGERLPSENDLAASSALSRQTVRQALSLLEQQGLIDRKQGSGSRVRAVSSPRPCQGRSHNIAVITTYIGEYIFPDILRGIEKVLMAHQYSPLISATRNRVDNERRILLDCLSRPIDGLIVEGTKTALPNPNLDLYQKLSSRNIPTVFVHGFYPDLPCPVFVASDDRKGGQQAAELLIKKGHTRIGGIFKSDDIQGHRRYAGYTQALRDAGLELADDRVLWYTTENRSSLLSSYALTILADCTAVVCYNDEVALQIIGILRTAHRRIPQDIALVSFDNSHYCSLSPVPITSFSCQKRQIGILAAQKLLHLIEGTPQQSTVLPWKLVERASC